MSFTIEEALEGKFRNRTWHDKTKNRKGGRDRPYHAEPTKQELDGAMSILLVGKCFGPNIQGSLRGIARGVEGTLYEAATGLTFEILTEDQSQPIVQPAAAEIIKRWLHIHRLRKAVVGGPDNLPSGPIYAAMEKHMQRTLGRQNWRNAYTVDPNGSIIFDYPDRKEKKPLADIMHGTTEEALMAEEETLRRMLSSFRLYREVATPRYLASKLPTRRKDRSWNFEKWNFKPELRPIRDETRTPGFKRKVDSKALTLYRIRINDIGAVQWCAYDPRIIQGDKLISKERFKARGYGFPEIDKVPNGVVKAIQAIMDVIGGTEAVFFPVNTQARYRDFVAQPLGVISALSHASPYAEALEEGRRQAEDTVQEIAEIQPEEAVISGRSNAAKRFLRKQNKVCKAKPKIDIAKMQKIFRRSVEQLEILAGTKRTVVPTPILTYLQLRELSRSDAKAIRKKSHYHNKQDLRPRRAKKKRTTLKSPRKVTT